MPGEQATGHVLDVAIGELNRRMAWLEAKSKHRLVEVVSVGDLPLNPFRPECPWRQDHDESERSLDRLHDRRRELYAGGEFVVIPGRQTCGLEVAGEPPHVAAVAVLVAEEDVSHRFPPHRKLHFTAR